MITLKEGRTFIKKRTKLKSKLSVAFSSNFTGAYKRFTLKHVKEHQHIPGAALEKPLHDCKVALVSTAGVHLKTDSPFDVDNPAGDHSIRIIPSYVEEENLTVTHIYYDTTSAKIDPTIVFPLPQLKELEKSGIIGSVSDVNIGLNGGILETELVEKESIPNVSALFKTEKVDVALLVPG